MQLSSYRSIVKRKGVPARIFAWNLSLPLQRLPKVIGCGKFNANTGTGWGGGRPSDKGEVSGQCRASASGLQPPLQPPWDPPRPTLLLTPVTGEAPRIVRGGRSAAADLPCVFFFFFEGGLTGVGPSPQEG